MHAVTNLEIGDSAMRAILAGMLLLVSAATSSAADPAGQPPQVIEPQPLPPIGYYRRSAYEVWQNLSVDRRGFFRARVIDTPYGAFYRYNGQPWFWTSTQQYRYMPAASD
jgi:hypothetical protein